MFSLSRKKTDFAKAPEFDTPVLDHRCAPFSDQNSFTYNVTGAPVHGWLSVLSPNKVDILRQQTAYFTSQVLLYIMYVGAYKLAYTTN